MRDLLFKHLTSSDKKRKIISSSEIMDNEGVRSIIRRHFACIVREVQDGKMYKPLPYLNVIKEHNSKEQKERFFCKLKGSVFAVSNGKLFEVLFMHSLRIVLAPAPHNLMGCSE